MIWQEWLALGLAVLGAINLILLWIAVRKDRKSWDLRMEEIEKRHTAALCESGARFARSRMRTRWAIRWLKKEPRIIE